jgi:hypothetical protein
LYLSTYETRIVLYIVYLMTILEQGMVLLEEILTNIFKELDPIWLMRMQRGDGESLWDM